MTIESVPETSAAGRLEALFRGLDEGDSPKAILGDLVRAVHTIAQPRANIRLAASDLPPGSFRITRLHTPDGARNMEEADWDAEIRDYPVHVGGILGEAVRTPGIKVLTAPDFTDDPVVPFLGREYRSGVALPLHSAAHPGNWLVVLSQGEELTEPGEVADLALKTHLIGMALDNFHLRRELAKENARKDGHLARLRAAQEALAPSLRALPNRYDIALSHTPYFQAGGDMALCLPLPGAEDNAEWVILVADITGHGPECTIMMGLAYALFRTALETARGPSELFTQVNAALCRWEVSGLSLLPAFVAFLNVETNQLRYASAGHPPALLLPANPDAAARPLVDAQGPLLGVLPSPDFPESAIALEPGGTVLIYTDGVSDARNPAGEIWGSEALHEAAQEGPRAAEACVAHVLQAAADFAQGTPATDDCTMAALHRPPA